MSIEHDHSFWVATISKHNSLSVGDVFYRLLGIVIHRFIRQRVFDVIIKIFANVTVAIK